MASRVRFTIKHQINKSESEELYALCVEKFLVALHWMIVAATVVVSFFTGDPQGYIENWNMTLYCNSEKFNQTATPITKKWTIATICVVVSLLAVLMCLKMMLVKLSTNVIEIVNFFTGFLLAWDLTYVLQTTISYPLPSFFKNYVLKAHYCIPKWPDDAWNETLHRIDLQSRGCFPSFWMCSASYCITFLFLYACHLDTGRNFGAKLFILIGPSVICGTFGWLLVHNNQNHPEDVFAGIAIGIGMAVLLMRDLFLKDKRLDMLTEDSITILMTREIETGEEISAAELTNQRGRRATNEYTMTLCSRNTSVIQPLTAVDDQPPPYSSVVHTTSL